MPTKDIFQTEVVEISSLHPHPRNYRGHSDDQLEHLAESMREHGVYRNVVIAKDGTILAGHGVIQAAEKMGKTTFPVIRLDIEPDSPRALKVLTGDNEIGRLAELNDRVLTEMLKEINSDASLLGTGYDQQMLSALAFVTRSSSEIKDFDAAAEWIGMPAHERSDEPDPMKLVVLFRTPEDRADYVKQIGLEVASKGEQISWTTWWPPREKDDTKNVVIDG